MGNTINEIQQEIIEEFQLFDDWADKYAYIIEMGKKLKPLPEEDKKPELLIKGCQSQVWLKASHEDGVVHFDTDSDAIIVKGLIYLLVRVLSDQPAQDIIQTNLDFIEKIGMKQHLSPTRSNGLLAMVKQMKLYALAINAQQGSKQ